MPKITRKLTGIKLVKNKRGQIWLYFRSKRLKKSTAIATILSHGKVADEIFRTWAKEQLDK